MRLRELAAHAQMSLGSTTYHFPDRESLLMAVLDSHTRCVEQAMATARDGAHAAPTATAAAAALIDAVSALYTDRDSVLVAAEIYLGATRDAAVADLAHRHRAALDSAIAETYVWQGQSPARARRQARIAGAVLDRAVLDRVTAPITDFTTQMTQVLTTLLLDDHTVSDPHCPLTNRSQR